MKVFIMALSTAVYWGPLSHIEVTEENRDGCEGFVTFKNAQVQRVDTFTYELGFKGIPFEVELQVNEGNSPDVLRVYPPEGYLAYPEEVSVGETATEEVCLFKDGYMGA